MLGLSFVRRLKATWTTVVTCWDLIELAVFLVETVFTVRRYALHGLCDCNSVRLAVRPSVRLSHLCTVSTRFDLRS